MRLIKDKAFGGEHPLSVSHDVHLDNSGLSVPSAATAGCGFPGSGSDRLNGYGGC